MEKQRSAFRDQDAANRAISHLESVLGEPFPEDFESLFVGNAEPDIALVNLGRWLAATANPQIHLQQIVALPQMAKLLLTVLGASQSITDSLIQNPELASLVLDPSELARPPRVASIIAEGRSILAASTSHAHALDRLRFLKQRWILPIVINDLAGTWAEEQVWTGLSDLAAALVELATATVWDEFARGRGLQSECPVMVVGFGKLGGRELNFSSDIDLAYVIPDGMGETFELHATRFCELLGRALSDRMGRGSLYRVDLRLRPYGSSGPLVSSMRAFESYYQLYAEQWEVQALIRSMPICGPKELTARWSEMRDQRCFRPTLSELELESMNEMKTRIEERSDSGDIKRGAGGIRDVEFLVQALQLLHGWSHPTLRSASTLPTLRELERLSIIERPVADSLGRGYTFLRQLEHRCQLVGDQQTHSIPHESAARERLAKLMGVSNWTSLEGELETNRRSIQSLYSMILRPTSEEDTHRDQVAARLGALAPGVLQWFDTMPSSEAFFASLCENRDSLARVERIAFAAPRLVNDFKSSVALTEMLVSGEIEEGDSPSRLIDGLPLDAPLANVADAYRRSKCIVLAQWSILEHDQAWSELAELADSLLKYCARRTEIEFDIIALGSFGAQEIGVESDADVLFLVADPALQAEAETQAQRYLSLFGQLRRSGLDLNLDLRLRPDGGKGMLVRSHDALEVYESSGLEMWERFALGQARLIRGNPNSLDLVRRVAYARPITSTEWEDLLAMKRRIETERVMPQNFEREVKLGKGGLNDLEWLVHLIEMRFPEVGAKSKATKTLDRVQNLGRAELLNAWEAGQVVSAHRYLLELRMRIALLGLEKDLVPENPDKLARLANTMDATSANEFLANHRSITESIRSIYLSTLERLNP